MLKRVAIAFGSAALLLAGCASVPQKTAEPSAELQRYLNHAGEPVDSFSVFGHVSGWNSLDDKRLVVWTGVNDAYLISVDDTCLNLEFAQTIGLTSAVGTRVHTDFDYVRFNDGFQGQRCRITEIRPVDYKAVKDERKAEKEAARAGSST